MYSHNLILRNGELINFYEYVQLNLQHRLVVANVFWVAQTLMVKPMGF